MKFTCTQENLNKGLNLVSHIAAKNTTLPILNNVLIRAEKGTVTLTTTNLELGVNCVVRGKVDKEGSFTVQSKLLNDFVNLVSNDTVEIDLSEDTLQITSESTETAIKGSPADEFPLIPEITATQPFTANVYELMDGMSQVLFAASHSETRPEISGIYMKFANGSLIMAATDSYRLAEKSIRCGGTEEKEVIIPQRALAELQRMLSNLVAANDFDGNENEEGPQVEIAFQDNQVQFSFRNITLVSRLIEGNYPAYQQIIPTEHKTRAVVSVEQLTKAVKTASLFSRLGVFDVNLELKNNSVTISATNAQLGQSKTTVAAEIDGDDNTIILNHKFLNDGLQNLNSTSVVIEMNNESSPCMLRPVETLEGKEAVGGQQDYLYIIMPIKQ